MVQGFMLQASSGVFVGMCHLFVSSSRPQILINGEEERGNRRIGERSEGG